MQLLVMATVMVLVVMATATAPAAARCGLSDCRPVNKSIKLESCGLKEEVVTAVCEGYCYHQDAVYTGITHRQGLCVGHWRYEEWLIQDCPMPVTFLRALSCSCGPCDAKHMNCGTYIPGQSSCHLY
ncbi:gonadotropin subunit beta-1-like [Eucyclogobius newberryi]|uniref:gonadotropin subunit beta-1-like n=1 Tax=Eucyclogobius newberryi TaxID=166745 RepID=UPI003B59FCD2